MKIMTKIKWWEKKEKRKENRNYQKEKKRKKRGNFIIFAKTKEDSLMRRSLNVSAFVRW